MNGSRFVGCVQLLVAAITWGSAFTVGKSALAHVDAYHLTTVRYGFAALIFMLLLAHVEGRRGFGASRGQSVRASIFGALAFPGSALMTFIGLAYTRPEHAAVIVGAQPLIAAIVVWVIERQRPPPRTMVALGLALAGVALVVTRGDVAILVSGDEVVGDLLILAGAICWVSYTLGASAFPGWSALRYTTVTMTYGSLSTAAITGIVIMAGEVTVPRVSQFADAGWEIAYITIGSALLGTLCWNSGIRRIGSDGVLFINFVPVTAFAIGVVQGNLFNWAELAGAFLVAIALFANHRRGRQAGDAAPR